MVDRDKLEIDLFRDMEETLGNCKDLIASIESSNVEKLIINTVMFDISKKYNCSLDESYKYWEQYRREFLSGILSDV